MYSVKSIDFSQIGESFSKAFGGIARALPHVKNALMYETRIMQNGPATILIIGDKKTVVKCHNEEFDIEKGIAMAILKHAGITRGDMARMIKSVEKQKLKEAGNRAAEAGSQETLQSAT